MRKHLVFDLDDTLIPSTQMYILALKKVGINSTGPEYQKARLSVKEQLGPAHPSSRNRLLYFKWMLENKKKFSPERALQLQTRYDKALINIVKADWKKLKRDRLMRLLSKKFHLSVVTNETTRTQLLKLMGIDPKAKYFKTVVTSEEAGVEKPLDKIFDLLLTRLGNPDPEEIILVGDSLINDIEPAVQRGWRAIWNKEFIQENENETMYESIDNLEELPGILGL
jgi:HAD superfamily hydrolase (TIGR01549 family)